MATVRVRYRPPRLNRRYAVHSVYNPNNLSEWTVIKVVCMTVQNSGLVVEVEWEGDRLYIYAANRPNATRKGRGQNDG